MSTVQPGASRAAKPWDAVTVRCVPDVSPHVPDVGPRRGARIVDSAVCIVHVVVERRRDDVGGDDSAVCIVHVVVEWRRDDVGGDGLGWRARVRGCMGARSGVSYTVDRRDRA